MLQSPTTVPAGMRDTGRVDEVGVVPLVLFNMTENIWTIQQQLTSSSSSSSSFSALAVCQCRRRLLNPGPVRLLLSFSSAEMLVQTDDHGQQEQHNNNKSAAVRGSLTMLRVC
jgi:hypothetical protein